MSRILVLASSLVLVVSSVAFADAPRLLLVGDQPALEAFSEALQVELAGQGWQILRAQDAVTGDTGLQRASEAQRMATALNARTAVWIEAGPEGGVMVRVIDADGDTPRHAPLPGRLEDVSPRVFSAIASSLLDELEAPPQPLRIRVQVSVEGGNFQADDAQAQVVVADPENTEVIIETDPVFNDDGTTSGEIVLPQSEIQPEQPSDELPAEPLPTEVVLAAPADTDDVDPDENRVAAFGFDLAPFVGMSSTARNRAHPRHISLGLGGTYASGVQGLGASIGVNIVGGDVSGGLFSVGGNAVTGRVDGVAMSTGFNWAGEGSTGALLSTGLNFAGGDSQGVHATAGANITLGEMNGLQLSSGVNYAKGGRGAQVGLLNIERGHFDGVQVGLLNISDDADFALGLVNIVRNGRTHLEATASADGFGFLALKHGGEYWHSIYSVGGHPGFGDGSEPAIAFGLGMGGHLPVRERLSLDLDLIGHYLYDGQGTDLLPNENGTEVLAQLRLSANIELFERFALVVGVSANVLYVDQDNSRYANWGRRIDNSVDVRGLQEDAVLAWPSLFVGVRAF